MKKKVIVLAFFAVILLSGAAFAQDHEGAAADTGKAYALVAAGFGMALATFGGALAQGKVAASAVEGIARNPGASGNMFLSFILGLALIESLVIYSLIIEFMILGKV
jgi:F-type H+-transporting ATPase subunit c